MEAQRQIYSCTADPYRRIRRLRELPVSTETRVAGEKPLIARSQVELSLSLSLSQQMEVVQLFFFFLSSLKVQKVILEKCVESRSRVVNYRHVEFPRLSNIDTFHDTIYDLYMLHFHRYNRFYNSYRFRQQTLKC